MNRNALSTLFEVALVEQEDRNAAALAAIGDPMAPKPCR